MKIVFKKILSCIILSILLYEPVYSEIFLSESIKKQLPNDFFSHTINAASTDMQTLGGYYKRYDADLPHAIVFHKFDEKDEEYSYKDMGTLNEDDTGSSEIYSMSNDGTRAVGYSSDNIKDKSAALWMTSDHNNWASVNLNEIENDSATSLRYSTAQKISPDGKIVKGVGYTNRKPTHAIFWYLSDRMDGKIVKIDSASSMESIRKLTQDIIPVVEQQVHKINSLQNIEGACSSFSKRLCYSLGLDYNAQKVARSNDLKFNLAYALNSNVIIGGVVLRPISSLLPNTHLPVFEKKQDKSSGIYIDIHTHNKKNFWYFKPSFSFIGGYHLDFYRPKVDQSESALGRSKLNGRGLMLRAGQNFTLDNSIIVDWSFGLGKVDIFRNEYSEKNVYHPFFYKMFSYKTKLLVLNAKIEVPFLEKMKWVSGVSIEHLLKKNIPFEASQESLGNVVYNLNFSSVKENFFSSIECKLNKNMKILLTGGISHTSTRVDHLSWNSSINFAGTF